MLLAFFLFVHVIAEILKRRIKTECFNLGHPQDYERFYDDWCTFVIFWWAAFIVVSLVLHFTSF